MTAIGLARMTTSTLFDVTIKSTMLLLVAIVIVKSHRRSSAALRHSIWSLALGSLLLLPVATHGLPGWKLPILPQTISAVIEGERVAAPFTPESLPPTTLPTNVQAMGATGDKETRAGSIPIVETAATLHTDAAQLRPAIAAEKSTPEVARPLDAVSVLVSIAWSTGVVCLTAQLLMGFLATRRLRNTSHPLDDLEWQRRLHDLRKHLGVTRPIELRECQQAVVPITWGVWRPVVLLPACARTWAQPMWNAVVLHELMHVRRRDVAYQVLGRIACVLFWFQPLAWYALRQLRQEREQACDDAVVHSGERASEYAEHLLQVARLCSPARGVSFGVAMAEGNSLERRMTSLFDGSRSHRPLTRRVFLVSTVIAALLLAGLAPLQPTATRAQQPPSSTSINEPTDVAENSPLSFDQFVWISSSNGIDVGFNLISTGEPTNRRVPLDSLVTYRVALKNRSNETLNVCFRSSPFASFEVPALVPSDQINSVVEQPELLEMYRSVAPNNLLEGLEPSFVVSLKPGEAVVVPRTFSLWVGSNPPEALRQWPRREQVTPGMNWIVQPVRTEILTADELASLHSSSTQAVATLSENGTSTAKATVTARGNGGTLSLPRIQLEVATLNAAAARHADQAVWGEPSQGIQCGIRLLNPQPSYRTGDILEAELLWRNIDSKPVQTQLPRQLDLYPVIINAEGHQPQIDFGPRFQFLPHSHQFEPGEIASLGIVKIRFVPAQAPSPASNREPGQIHLPPGKYSLLGSGGVGNINPSSGAIPFTVALDKDVAGDLQKLDTKPLRGRVVDEQKQGVADAEILVVVKKDLDNDNDTRVIAKATTDADGNYVAAIPSAELGQRQWASVWRRAAGYAAARGNSISILDSLLEKPLEHPPLIKTAGTTVLIRDPQGQPLSQARVEVIAIKVQQGVGYKVPAEWLGDFAVTTDARGLAHFPATDPEALHEFEITPAGQSTVIHFDANYFLNFRPEAAVPNFTFQTFPTGALAGQLLVQADAPLPAELQIPVMSVTKTVGVQGITRAKVDAEGRFAASDLPVGQIFIPKFLPDDQPTRAQIPRSVKVVAGETTQLEIPVTRGTHVVGRVERSDTKTPVADYRFAVIYGPSITFSSAGVGWVMQKLTTDANGRYELYLPPGPINLRLTAYVAGYTDATSWLPEKQRGLWGPLFEIPAQPEFELPPISLVKMQPIQGKLVDQTNTPLANDDWTVFGYPEIPDARQGFVMNSMAGVQTGKDGLFQGHYPETYPPVRWEVSHRVWKTKYDFDDIKFEAKVIQQDPRVLQIDTTKPKSDE